MKSKTDAAVAGVPNIELRHSGAHETQRQEPDRVIRSVCPGGLSSLMRFDSLQQMGCLLFASLALNVALLTLRGTATRPELALDKQSVSAESQPRSARQRERPSLVDALSFSDKTTHHGYDRVYTHSLSRCVPSRHVSSRSASMKASI